MGLHSRLCPTLLQICAFGLASVLEVHVDAAQLLNLIETKQPIEFPEGCLLESSICALKTGAGQKYNLTLASNLVTLSENSAFERKSQGMGRLLAGTVLVVSAGTKGADPYWVETSFGAMSFSNGMVLISKLEKKVRIQVLRGEVILRSTGASEEIRVVAGQQNWLGGVSTKGIARVGFPEPLDTAAVLTDLARISNMSKEDWKTLLTDLKEDRQAAVYSIAVVNKTVVDRQIASIEERDRLEQERKKRWEEERNHWHRMMWNRNFE